MSPKRIPQWAINTPMIVLVILLAVVLAVSVFASAPKASNMTIIRNNDQHWMGSCNGHSQMVYFLSQGHDDAGNMIIVDQGDPNVALYATRHSAPGRFTICGSTFDVVWDYSANDWIIQVTDPK